jgi:hypothetical protein
MFNIGGRSSKNSGGMETTTTVHLIFAKHFFLDRRHGPVALLKSAQTRRGGNFALGLDACIRFQLSLKALDRIFEKRGSMRPRLPDFPSGDQQAQFGGRPEGCFEAAANQLAVDFDSAILSTAADVLQQVRHLGKGAPLAVNEIKVARVAELADALDSGSSE